MASVGNIFSFLNPPPATIEYAFLSDAQRAAILYGAKNQYFTSIPRYKHLFFIRFITTTQTPTTVSSSDYSRNMWFKVKTVEKPKVNYETEMLNEYNKKRQVHKKLEYMPITVRFQDTVDNTAFSMWNDYSQYNWNDWVNKNDSSWVYDQTSATYFQGANNSDWGFNINNKTTAGAGGINVNNNFFDLIAIYDVWGGSYKSTHLINPKITNFTPDTVDYSAGGEFQEISMTFAYEGIVFNQQKPLLNAPEDLISLFGLQVPVTAPDGYPVEARVGNPTTVASSSPFATAIADVNSVINTAQTAANYALQIQQTALSVAGIIQNPVAGITGLANAAGVNVAGAANTASILNNFGNFLFNGLPSNQPQNNTIAQAFVMSPNLPTLTQVFGSSPPNSGAISQNNNQFGSGVNTTTTGSTTANAIIEAGNVQNPTPSYVNQNNGTSAMPPNSASQNLAAADNTPIPTGFAVQVATTIPIPDALPNPPWQVSVAPPNSFLASNVVGTNLVTVSQQGQGATMQLSSVPGIVPGSTTQVNPGISANLFDTQVGKIAGNSAASPTTRATAGILTAAAMAGAYSTGSGSAVNTLEATALNAIAVQANNAGRSPTSQIGYRIGYPNVPFAPGQPPYIGWNPPANGVLPVYGIAPSAQNVPGSLYAMQPGQYSIYPSQVYSPTGALIAAETRSPEQDATINS